MSSWFAALTRSLKRVDPESKEDLASWPIGPAEWWTANADTPQVLTWKWNLDLPDSVWLAKFRISLSPFSFTYCFLLILLLIFVIKFVNFAILSFLILHPANHSWNRPLILRITHHCSTCNPPLKSSRKRLKTIQKSPRKTSKKPSQHHPSNRVLHRHLWSTHTHFNRHSRFKRREAFSVSKFELKLTRKWIRTIWTKPHRPA